MQLKTVSRLCRCLFGMLVSVATSYVPIHAQINIPYDKLNDCQQKRFVTFHPGPEPVGPQTWKILDDSQRLEYAGGTQALTTVDISAPPCKGLQELASVTAIWGIRSDHSSADQFHVEVNWVSNADKGFKTAPGWSSHNALLHPGQYGFQENRDGNPFLGIVVLFDTDNPKTGQFHIGFRSGFSHYFADNGNIAKNYGHYCQWYGRINGYTQQCASDTIKFDWRSVRPEDMRNTVDETSVSLRDTVRRFLTEWYVKQNIDALGQFVAKDNAVRALIAAGYLPEGTFHARWSDIFSEAFEGGPGAVHFSELANAIEYRQPNLPEVVTPLLHLNDHPSDDHFAIIAPQPPANLMYFPADDVTNEEMDSSSRFLRHLKQEYVGQNPDEGNLQLVIYTTIGPGLLHEGCVLYWIKETGRWRLAAFQGTD